MLSFIEHRSRAVHAFRGVPILLVHVFLCFLQHFLLLGIILYRVSVMHNIRFFPYLHVPSGPDTCVSLDFER
jgi:hypothetical protein